MPNLPPKASASRNGVCVKCKTAFPWYRSTRCWCWWCEGKPKQKGKKR